MFNEVSINIPTISTSQTASLTTLSRLIGSTANDIFSFRGTTAAIKTMPNPTFFLPTYERLRSEPKEDDAEMILKKYESIVKNKLRSPIDIKKLYYEQFE